VPPGSCISERLECPCGKGFATHTVHAVQVRSYADCPDPEFHEWQLECPECLRIYAPLAIPMGDGKNGRSHCWVPADTLAEYRDSFFEHTRSLARLCQAANELLIAEWLATLQELSDAKVVGHLRALAPRAAPSLRTWRELSRRLGREAALANLLARGELAEAFARSRRTSGAPLAGLLAAVDAAAHRLSRAALQLRSSAQPVNTRPSFRRSKPGPRRSKRPT